MSAAKAILGIITAITAQLETSAVSNPRIKQILHAIHLTPLSPEDDAANLARAAPPHAQALGRALEIAPKPTLAPIVDAIETAEGHLHWRIDAGLYYEAGSNVGEGYAGGNMHCELIGPEISVFPSRTLRLGLFLLKPRILYRDHEHPAAELYFNLSGPTGWRFDSERWQDFEAGSVIWNSPHRVHATRVYDEPFLAVYAWAGDVFSSCRVVHMDDWSAVEAELSA